MRISADIKKRVSDRVVECINLYTKRTGRTFNRDITTTFDLTGACAGIAQIRKNNIRLNPDIMMNNNIDEFIHKTVGHEVSHLIACHHLNSKGHDKAWQIVMQKIGLKPERCHTYDLSNVKVRRQNRWLYTCKCRTHVLTTTRHNKVIKKGIRYRCIDCHEEIRFSEKVA